MIKITSPELLRRTLQALTETCVLIEKESRYPKDLQKLDYLAGLERHAKKLDGMISEYRAR